MCTYLTFNPLFRLSQESLQGGEASLTNRNCLDNLSTSFCKIKTTIANLASTIYNMTLSFFMAIDLCFLAFSCVPSKENESNEEERESSINQRPSLVAFYKHQSMNDRGLTLQQIWNFSYSRLEDNHEFIQWLFPLDAPSLYNPTAPLVTAEIQRQFREDHELQENLRHSLHVMLDFYGFKEDPSTHRIIKAENFAIRSRMWVHQFNHNLKRLDRMIRSLALLGLTEEAIHLYQALEDLYLEGRVEVHDSLISFWKSSILDFVPSLVTRV